MRSLFTRLGLVTGTALATVVSGIGTATADSYEYGTLLADPNVITDSAAWSAGTPTSNPDGKPGISITYTHRDNSRTITETVFVLSTPEDAKVAVSQAQASSPIANSKTLPISVGTDGQLVTGTSTPDSRKPVSILYFTEGNAASITEFTSKANDPAPIDVITSLGAAQDSAIKNHLGG